MPELREERFRRYMISANPLKLLSPLDHKFLNAYFHYALTTSLVLGLGVQIPSPLSDNDISGIAAQPEIFYAFSEDPFGGFFAGAGALLSHLSVTETINETDNTYSYTDDVFAVRAFLGFHIEAVEKGFMTSILAGGELNISPETEAILGYFGSKEGLVPYVSLRMGYAW